MCMEHNQMFMDAAREFINCPEMQKSLVKEGGKELWVNFLQSGDMEKFSEEERPLLEAMVQLTTQYALSVAWEQYATNEKVSAFMDLLQKMHEGQELHEEVERVADELPEEFKLAVEAAGQQADLWLIELLNKAV